MNKIKQVLEEFNQLELLENFEREGIDDDSFDILDEETIKLILTKAGPRLTFTKKYKEYLSKNGQKMPGYETRSDDVASVPDSEVYPIWDPQMPVGPMRIRDFDIRAVLCKKMPEMAKLLDEMNATKITHLDKLQINRVIVDNYLEKFGVLMTTKDKINLARSVVTAFPVLKSDEGAGYEEWYLPGLNGNRGSGFIHQRVKNYRSRKLSSVEKEDLGLPRLPRRKEPLNNNNELEEGSVLEYVKKQRWMLENISSDTNALEVMKNTAQIWRINNGMEKKTSEESPRLDPEIIPLKETNAILGKRRASLLSAAQDKASPGPESVKVTDKIVPYEDVKPLLFGIVNFVESNEVEVVPLSWVQGTSCAWPPVKSCDVHKLIKKYSEPSKQWIRHRAKILGEFTSYDTARQHLKKAECESDLSETEKYGRGKRKRIPRRLSISSESEEENDDRSEGSETPPSEKKTKSSSLSDSLPTKSTTVPYIRLPSSNPEVPSSSSSIEEMIQFLTKEIQVLKDNQQYILQNQELILNILEEYKHDKTMSENDSTISEPVLPVNLPLTSLEDILILEETLQDSSVFDYLVNKLSVCGDSNLGDTVKRILQQILADSVAHYIGCLADKRSEVFSQMLLIKIVFVTIRSNALLGFSASDDAIETAIKDWLRQAARRNFSLSKSSSESNTPDT